MSDNAEGAVADAVVVVADAQAAQAEAETGAAQASTAEAIAQAAAVTTATAQVATELAAANAARTINADQEDKLWLRNNLELQGNSLQSLAQRQQSLEQSLPQLLEQNRQATIAEMTALLIPPESANERTESENPNQANADADAQREAEKKKPKKKRFI